MTKTRDLADLGGGFIQAGSGAEQRTVESKLQDVVSVLDFIPQGEHAAIKAGTSTYDASDAIQAALVASQDVYLPQGTYKTTKTINITSAEGVTKRTRLFGDGGCNPKTIVVYTPSVPGDPAFRVTTGGSELRGFQLTGPGADSRPSPEIAIDFRNADLSGGGSQQGTLIEDMQIRDFGKAGLYLCQQWLMQVNLCRFISCGQRTPSVLSKTGGIVFDQTGSGLAGWSSSGVSINDVYFASCSYGIYSDAAWNLATYGCIFEYCTYPYYRGSSGNTHTMVAPWFESNGNAPQFGGGMIIQGGRGVSYGGTSYTGTCVTHLDNGVKLVRSGSTVFELDNNGDVSLGSATTGVVMDSAGLLSGTNDFKLRIEPDSQGAAQEYIACGPTYRDGDGLNKLLVYRHGYYGNSTQEVASIGVLTGSNAGGSGTGSGSLVFYTGTSGNGDGGSTSTEHSRITSTGIHLFGTTSAVGSSRVQVVGSTRTDELISTENITSLGPTSGKFIRATSGASNMSTASSIDLATFLTSGTVRSVVGYVYASTNSNSGHRTRTWKVSGKPGTLALVVDIDSSSSSGGSTPNLTLSEPSAGVLTMTPSWAFGGQGYTWTIDLSVGVS